MKKTLLRRLLLATVIALALCLLLYPLLLPTENYFRLVLQLLPVSLFIGLILIVPLRFFSEQISKEISQKLKGIRIDSKAALADFPELRPIARQITSLRTQVAAQMDELTGQQEQLKVLMDNMQEGLLLISPAGRVLSCNRAAKDLLGREPSDREFASVYDLSDSTRFHAVVRHALGGLRDSVILNMENGTALQLMANPVSREGQAGGAVLMLLDVTEREKRDALRREFTSNVSHELKTPLTSIYGIADMMESGMVREEDISGFAKRIRDESARMITLIEDIIRLSRLDDDSFSEEIRELDLYEIAQSVCARLQASAESKHVTMTLEGSKALMQGVPVIVDEMLYNLCDNAVKYNDEGGEVLIRVTGSEQTAVFSVTDTGIGIPQADRERIFERFYRVDKSHSREIGGTGLGLSIVKHGAAYHNATIELESKLGVGTTISLYFPCSEEAAVTAEVAEMRNPLNVEVPGTHSSGLITVLEEDEPEMIPETVSEDPLLLPQDFAPQVAEADLPEEPRDPIGADFSEEIEAALQNLEQADAPEDRTAPEEEPEQLPEPEPEELPEEPAEEAQEEYSEEFSEEFAGDLLEAYSDVLPLESPEESPEAPPEEEPVSAGSIVDALFAEVFLDRPKQAEADDADVADDADKTATETDEIPYAEAPEETAFEEEPFDDGISDGSIREDGAEEAPAAEAAEADPPEHEAYAEEYGESYYGDDAIKGYPEADADAISDETAEEYSDEPEALPSDPAFEEEAFTDPFADDEPDVEVRPPARDSRRKRSLRSLFRVPDDLRVADEDRDTGKERIPDNMPETPQDPAYPAGSSASSSDPDAFAPFDPDFGTEPARAPAGRKKPRQIEITPIDTDNMDIDI